MKFVTVAAANYRRHYVARKRPGRDGGFVIVAECPSAEAAAQIADALNTDEANAVMRADLKVAV